jgi:hypothetical protein
MNMLDYAKISELISALLMATLVPLAGFGVQLLIAKVKVERGKLSEQQNWMIDNAVNIGVYAAEQIYKSGEGDMKKAKALAVAQGWLEAHNISINLDQLDAAIEAEVKRAFDHPALSAQA